VWTRQPALTLVATVRGTPALLCENRNESFLPRDCAWSPHGGLPVNLVNRRCENIFSSESSPHRRRRSAKSGRSRPANLSSSISAASRNPTALADRETPKSRYLSTRSINIPHRRRSSDDVDVDFGVFLTAALTSLVSAVVRSLYPKRPLKAYTLRFEERSFDEGRFAAVCATIENGTCDGVGQTDEVRHGLRFSSAWWRPLADPAWIPATLLAQRAAQDDKWCSSGRARMNCWCYRLTSGGVAERFARLPPGQVRLAPRSRRLPSQAKKVTISFLSAFVQGQL